MESLLAEIEQKRKKQGTEQNADEAEEEEALPESLQSPKYTMSTKPSACRPMESSIRTRTQRQWHARSCWLKWKKRKRRVGCST